MIDSSILNYTITVNLLPGIHTYPHIFLKSIDLRGIKINHGIKLAHSKPGSFRAENPEKKASN